MHSVEKDTSLFIMFILMLIIGYLFGSINSAILTCHALRLPSPRSIGSGNPGATNVLRLGGKKAAAITLIGDALKGCIPVVIAHGVGLIHLEIGYVALLAVLGHIFPIFFGFRGGKRGCNTHRCNARVLLAGWRYLSDYLATLCINH